jgi:ATP-dependent DNA helicase RecG
MTNTEFLKYIKQSQEHDQLAKYKANYEINQVLKDVVGMLNKEGGIVFIEGIADPETHQESINKAIEKKIIPHAPIWLSIENIENKKVIVLQFWGGSKKPYLVDNIIYERVGSQTQRASIKVVNQIIEERVESIYRWERLPSNIKIDDIDSGIITSLINNQNHYTEQKQDWNNDLNLFLSDFGLFSNANYSNATVILFAKKPEVFLPQCRVRFTQFKDDKSGELFSDKLFEGNIFKLIKDIITFYESIQIVDSKIKDNDWQRRDILRYPPIAAFREGINNALVHRDYSDWSSNIQINLYHDKIQIINSGDLPDGMTVSELKRIHSSKPHNPDIAHICFLAGFIEKIGRGTNKIIEACKEAGLKEPVWVSENHTITLTFHLNQSKTLDDLNPRQLFILDIMDREKSRSLADLMKFLRQEGMDKFTDRTIRGDLTLLEDLGLIFKRGKASNTLYVRSGKSIN